MKTFAIFFEELSSSFKSLLKAYFLFLTFYSESELYKKKLQTNNNS